MSADTFNNDATESMREPGYTKDVLRQQLKRAKEEITKLNQVLHDKNLALDALHYVWCDGGCQTGTHRWTEQSISEEVVIEAERNTKRLRQWFESEKVKRGQMK